MNKTIIFSIALLGISTQICAMQPPSPQEITLAELEYIVRQELMQRTIAAMSPVEKQLVFMNQRSYEYRDLLSSQTDKEQYRIMRLKDSLDGEGNIFYLLSYCDLNPREFSPLVALYLLLTCQSDRLIELQASGIDISEAVKHRTFKRYNRYKLDTLFIGIQDNDLHTIQEILNAGISDDEMTGAISYAEEIGNLDAARFLRRYYNPEMPTEEYCSIQTQKAMHLDDKIFES